ncbi:hypothetical protein D9619_011183 [Psilocybe cf. subviscida]|uniref:HAT C-terminal dimerisation domain-containing protein n=1 Tax=Psilocybe cf. subviscida TaxID=2480587 RepID=A0A8H5BK98_9AGAR|nr:hypothetical protein D9619_011183 [Psilocybe cf. subviscida]
MAPAFEKKTTDENNGEIARLARAAELKAKRLEASAKKRKNAPEKAKAAPSKKAKTSQPPPTTHTNSASRSSRQPSVEDADDEDEVQVVGGSLSASSRYILVGSDEENEDDDKGSDDDEGEEIQEVEKPGEDDEAELNRLMKKWTSPIYAFFKATPRIEYKKGRRMHVFECLSKTCRGKGNNKREVNRYVDTADSTSTSNLRKHAKLCWGDDTITAADDTNDVAAARKIVNSSGSKDGSITASFKRIGKGKVTYSHKPHTKTETRAVIVRWVTENHRPFNIVKDEAFNCMMKTGRTGQYIPSPSTVSKDVKGVFTRARSRIAKLLQEHDGQLSFATDAWTSPNHKAFIALTVHFEHNGDPVCLLLDLVEVPRSHTGLNLALAFTKILEDFGISQKDERAARDDYEADDNDEEDDSSDLTDWQSVTAGMSAEELADLQESVQPVRLLLVKLRKIAFAIKNSSTILLPRWFALLEELKLRSRIMPHDVAMRWNSTFDMLIFALKYRKAIDVITQEREMNLRKYELTDEEWETAGQLKRVLKIFKDATKFFSRSMPNIANVIPSMDLIDERLTTIAADVSGKWTLAIQAAATVAKKLLNKYYSATDLSEIYRIAMILHPKRKLQYFIDAGWTEAWLVTARELVEDKFNELYASRRVSSVAPRTPSPNKPSATLSDLEDDDDNIFDNMDRLQPVASEETQDKLAQYLAAPVEKVSDGLKWWTARKQMYPRLSRMALDYLSIPPTSVDVERVFSQGRIELSHLRNCLSAQTVRATMCVGAWSKAGYVRSDDITAVVMRDEVPEGEKEEPLANDWDRIVV